MRKLVHFPCPASGAGLQPGRSTTGSSFRVAARFGWSRALLAVFLSVLAFSQGACSSPGDNGYDDCVVVLPDGGTSPGLACDIGWSCNDDGTHYELACTFQSGDFACACYADGAATKSFSVNAFTCDNNGALPSAQSACGWAISVR